MKKLLLALLFLLTQFGYSQNTGSSCENAYSLCGAFGFPFSSTVGGPTITPQDPAFGCLFTRVNPTYFYLPVNQSGDLQFSLELRTISNNMTVDTDFICWGPFENTAAICGPENINENNIVDCGYNVEAVETLNIPNATAGTFYVLMTTNFSNRPANMRVTELNPNEQAAQACSGINMRAFLDNNANGVMDAGEENFPYGNFVYQVNNAGVSRSISSFNGRYFIPDDTVANSYTLNYTIPSRYSNNYTSTTSYQNINPQPRGSMETFYFPVTVEEPFTDVRINIIPTQAPQPGFTLRQKIIYTNIGLTVQHGSINFTAHPGFTVTETTSSDAVITPSGFNLDFTDLAPFETRTLFVNMTVPVIPDVSLGDLVSFTAEITIDGDITPEDNTSTATQTIIGSYDPNDITESRGPEIMIDDFDDSDYLYYTIRFQNTGTAPARNARIESLLNNFFDYGSVEMLHSSHNFVFERQNNLLKWHFNQIQLPAEQDDEPASHGYVYFRIKPMPGYEVGDIIPNRASIYFDFNPAIVTNTFRSEFVDNVASNKPFEAIGFSLYPNPAKGSVNILSQGNTAIATVKISDLTGKTIYTLKNTTTGVLTINTAGFASGTYFVEIAGINGIKTVKKLLVE
ncbi:T9SS type A sorting domain-containing protein [Flavobacterium sp. Sd200]|uniref:T9SS type A sorting domain-containing protein n=1 Tax=Flavobacterium sp. Sd200 TaxID=2692211 RepID=UPI001370601D|nr:T9SS type A sorting domain-containing protein [Flavobacterium sp. Sd200]MXN91552.1 T9SS type A sorting domain-containing protein [Flavobacterium sp. Sd200]